MTPTSSFKIFSLFTGLFLDFVFFWTFDAVARTAFCLDFLDGAMVTRGARQLMLEFGFCDRLLRDGAVVVAFVRSDSIWACRSCALSPTLSHPNTKNIWVEVAERFTAQKTLLCPFGFRAFPRAHRACRSPVLRCLTASTASQPAHLQFRDR